MTSEGTGPQGAQQQVIDRASSDPEFRAQLLENPKEAISKQLGVPLPEGITIRAIEEQPGEVVLVLPARGTASGARLSSQDLEQVAGGGSANSYGSPIWMQCC
jgi:hypothetical protein